MPKRTDIHSILIIGAGPIVIGQACEFDYSGAQACKALREEGYRVVLVNSNPATIMTDPEMADATYIEPITWQMVEKVIALERPDALLPTMGGQTALNCALDLAKHGVLEKYGVEMIGAQPRGHRQGGGPREVQGRDDPHRPGQPALGAGAQHGRSDAGAGGARLPGRDPAVLHAGRQRRRHRLQPRGVPHHLRARLRGLAHARAADRGVGDRLERVRDGGGARPQGQLHHRLLHREPRPDGRAHRRLDHRGPGADADRQGIPDHARRLDRGAARDRGRYGRVQRPVRHQPAGRAHGGDRDEPARVALLGARVQGNRLPDRQGRGQARGRLHAGRAAQRHHRRRDAGLVRADHRLRRHQGPALRIREVPAGRPAPHHADEIGGRSDGHRPHLPGVVAEGLARSGNRRRRLRREYHRPRADRARARAIPARTGSGTWPMPSAWA